jgi:hypothetical protein
LLACAANNAFHLWLNTSFEEKNIITPEPEALKYAPQGVRNILLLGGPAHSFPPFFLFWRAALFFWGE